MTSIRDATDMVLNCNPNDWELFEPLDTHTYAPDVNLTLVGKGVNHKDFSEKWSSSYATGSTSYNYYLYYNNSPIDYIHAVSVDDGRAMIPVPDRNHTNASKEFSLGNYKQKLARILTHRPQDLQGYYTQGNIELR